MSDTTPIDPGMESLMKEFYGARDAMAVYSAGRELHAAALKLLAGTPSNQVYDVGTALEKRFQELGHNR